MVGQRVPLWTPANKPARLCLATPERSRSILGGRGEPLPLVRCSDLACGQWVRFARRSVRHPAAPADEPGRRPMTSGVPRLARLRARSQLLPLDCLEARSEGGHKRAEGAKAPPPGGFILPLRVNAPFGARLLVGSSFGGETKATLAQSAWSRRRSPAAGGLALTRCGQG